MKKRDRDVARKRYFADKERLADLVNVFLRRTQEEAEEEIKIKLLRAENLEEIGQEQHTLDEQRDGKYSRKRIVDAAGILHVGRGKCGFFLENQELMDYRMPERILDAESIWYHERVYEIRKKHERLKDWKSSEEKVCGFSKEDRMMPVISLVVYYGEKCWKGTALLHEMMDFAELPKIMQKLVNNYKIHVLDVKRFEHLEWFTTDLKATFGFIKYAADKEKLRLFVREEKKYFENLPEDAYDFIAFQTGTGKLEQFKERYQKKEGKGYNMCKALDDMERLAEERGRIQGERKGEAKLEMLMKYLLEENGLDDIQKVISNRAYRGRLYKKFGI